jgi:hypothetical protein
MLQGGHERILAAAGKHGVPVMIYPGGEYPALTNYVSKFDSVLVHCHVGMGVERAALPDQLEATIDQLVACSKYPKGHAPGSRANLSVSRPDRPTGPGRRRFRRQAPDVGQRLYWNR